MRIEKNGARLAAGIFGFLTAYGGIGCIVTGLRFDGISMVTITVVCAIAAAVFAVTAGHKSFLVIPAVLVLIGLRLWHKGPLNLGAEAFLAHISHLYDLGYGWGVIRWSEEYISVDMAQLALCVLAVLIALGVCWSFLKCKGVWITAILVSAPVIPCMILTDTVPSAFYLFIQLLCLVLLLMIRLARKRGQGMALLKLLALPMTAAVLILFVCMPQRSYTSLEPVDAVLRRVQEFFADSSEEPPKAPVREESDWVNLTTVGPKNHRRGVVMEVTDSQSGYLYLKGNAFDTYYGTWWDCRATSRPIPEGYASYKSVRITTRAMHDILYLPYGAYSIGYSSNGISLAETKGRVENAGPWRSYNVKYRQQPEYNDTWQLPSEDAPEMYLQLQRDTQAAALAYLAREMPELETVEGVWDKANAIVDHVSQSALYSLQTPKMPADRDDFAMWFLEESDTGYCVHFASAATVLLRAAGIPARYVTGYLVNTQTNRMVEVYQNNAHAWTECYIDGVGWVPLEPTPAGGVADTVGIETTAPTEGTTVPQDTENTETTEATQSTETTGATQTTEPTQTQQTQETTEETAPTKPAENPSESTGTIGGADGPNSENDGPAQQPREMPGWLKWVLGLLGAAGAVIGQWRLRVKLRERKRNRGRKTAQTLARWQEAVLHCRVRGDEPDARLHDLAQKARFSHHAVTREELKEFDNWLSGSKRIIQHMGFWQKFLATIIFALY